MISHDDDLDDEERMTDGSGLLGGEKKEEDKFEVPCCGWMSVRYYQPVSVGERSLKMNE